MQLRGGDGTLNSPTTDIRPVKRRGGSIHKGIVASNARSQTRARCSRVVAPSPRDAAAASAAIPRSEIVASFQHGIAVLRSFSREHRRQTISEVAFRTGLTRATARRLLLTLCKSGLACTDGKFFQLSPGILALGQSFLAGMTELEIVREVLLGFTRSTGGSASAGMLVGTEVIYVTRLPSPQGSLPLALGPGMRQPAHATSIGHVLLAGLHPREFDRYLETAVLEPCTPCTIVDKRVLRERIEQTRAQGYALAVEEVAAGHVAVAVPVEPIGTGMPQSLTRLGLGSGVNPHPIDIEAIKASLLPPLRRAAADIAVLTTHL